MLCFYAFASVKQLLLFCCTTGDTSMMLLLVVVRCLCCSSSSGFKIILINFVVATITYKTIVYFRFPLPLSLSLALSFQTARWNSFHRIYFIRFKIVHNTLTCSHFVQQLISPVYECVYVCCEHRKYILWLQFQHN